MKRGHVTSAILATIAAGVLGITLTAAASPAPASRPRTAAVKPDAVVLNCLNKPQVEPHSFVLACADANSSLTRLGWSRWTLETGSAVGTLVQNDCIPFCAAGHFHRFPVRVVLSAPVSYGHHHGQRYSEITMTFPGARPLLFNGRKWVPGPRTLTSSLWGAILSKAP